ncbi:MAG: PilZ domain-containing protein [Sphingomonadales bacterium]|nr:PilZ domain-containing protein [Sphingomonadales bacterium]
MAPAPHPSGEDQRAAPRFTLLLRTAKLIADGREFVCVLRDASDTGVKVRLFHPLPAAQAHELELADGTRLPLDPVWERGGHAGFRFVTPIDVRTMIEDFDGPYPRRPLRLQLHNHARVTAHGDIREARIINLSQQGACIQCDEHLMLQEKICIEGDLMPPIVAHVCWRDAPRYGLAFEQLFQLDELARFIARVQDGGPAEPGRRTAA